MPSRGKIIVTGAIAAHPIGGGGNTWAFLQYVLGFVELGFEVAYCEEISPERCIDEDWHPAPFSRSVNARYLRSVAEQFGFGDRFFLLCGSDSAGLREAEALRFAADARLIVLLSGRFHHREIIARAKRRMYVDLDPGFTQIWQQRYGVDMNLSGHDVYCTVGLHLTAPDCPVPRCGIDWQVTVPPVVLKYWEPIAEDGQVWTTVADWRGYSPVEWQGQWYGQKSEEFLKIIELPRSAAVPLELCLAIHPDEPDLPRLRANGWRLVAPTTACRSPEDYRAYVRASRGEFSVAKNGYVTGKTGWFSDRSACYLAAGRPVVVQDTGFSAHLPTGEGLLTFRTLEEAQAALRTVEAEYDRHRRAARRLAEQYFSSEIVLPRLLALAGI